MATRIFFVFALLIAAVLAQDFTPVVQTNKGPVIGSHFYTIWHSYKYSSFLGIPYADPPVGSLRFKGPVEPAPWTDVYNATDEGSPCPQNFLFRTLGAEDCLYLNVYSPLVDFENITELLPVMVWVYGGGFTTGTANHNIYAPDFFLEQGVLFVSMNYRLDVFGGLYLNISGATGNQGLQDQYLALQWVQKNIAAFGGDPKQVTLFGESAGSVSVGYHMLSPKSQGLFQKVIMQSGTPLCPWGYRNPSDSITNALLLCELMGNSTILATDCLNFLQNADVEALLNVTQYMSQSSSVISFPFVPTTDNDFVTDCPIAMLQSGNYSHVPVLMGYNAYESIIFYATADIIRMEAYTALVTLSHLNPFSNTTILNLANLLADSTIRDQIDVSSLYNFFAPIDLMERYLAQNSTLYYYRLSYDSIYALHKVLTPDLDGTSHIDDVGYLFNIPVIYPISPDHYVNQFRYKMVSYWVNFAKYGNPTPANQTYSEVTWEAAGTTGMQIDINQPSTMNSRLLNSDQVTYEQLYYNNLPIVTQCKNFQTTVPGPF